MNFIEQTRSTLQENGLFGWVIALVVAVLMVVIAKIILKIVIRNLAALAKNTVSEWDDIAVDVLSATKSWVLFVWFMNLQMKAFVNDSGALRIASGVSIVATLLQVAIWAFRAMGHWRERLIAKQIAAGDGSSTAALGLMSAVIKGALIVTLLLIGLSNLGIDIGALLAGLGVGGIAVALAAQNVLGDLFASLSIILDKPFVVGDNIRTGTDEGTVENIGLKTTRVRSITGEELVFSNKDLLESRVANFKRMRQRRGSKIFGVTYSTPIEKLEAIPNWVRDVVKSNPRLSFERCHLVNYGGSSLDFEMVFWVLDAEMNSFVAEQEKIMLALIRKFTQEKVEFAFPTQTLYLEGGSALERTRQPEANA